MLRPSRAGSSLLKPAPKSTGGAGAIVVGGDYQGLGIVRSLGRQQVPVCVIDDEVSIARFSQHATHAFRVANLRDEEQAVETILRVGGAGRFGGWVLYPTRDETVAALSRHRSLLSECFRVPTPDWTAVQWAWDKRNTYRLAEKLGIPTPRTWCPRGPSELDKVPFGPPYAIKPAVKEHFFYATKAKAWKAKSRQELARLYTRAAQLVQPGEVMVQDIIPGDGRQQFAYCAFFKEGRPLASMVARRCRQHPPEFGRASTFVETVKAPTVEVLSEAFLRAINYYGLVEFEYKLDPRDGEYKLLDVNARTWGYHTLGLAAGVDFPYLLYADQMGAPVETCRARPGVKWIRRVTDLPTGLSEVLRGRLPWHVYALSLKRSDVDAVFDREDPLPGLLELLLLPYLYFRRGF